jgi:hypothetical protein
MDPLSRALRNMTSQEVARANAAAAAADLEQRRQERNEVDTYLLTRSVRYGSGTDAARDATPQTSQ